MKTIIKVEAEFNSSLERAFKTPILGDATKFLTGYGIIPPVEKFTEDSTWGKINGSRIPHSAKSFMLKGGEIGLDSEVGAEKGLIFFPTASKRRACLSQWKVKHHACHLAFRLEDLTEMLRILLS